MNRTTSLIVGAVLLASVAGCASIEVLPSHEPYKRSNGEAIVLVGTLGDSLSVLIGTGQAITNEVALLASRKGMDVFALRVPVGEAFSIYTLSYVGAKHRYGFSDPPKLKADKPGIYFYGTLDVRDKPTLSQKESSNLIALARNKYKSVFDQLQPINFR
jgi:hypothetical protein